MSETAAHGEWLVGNPGRMAQLAALWAGSTGLLILGLQPVLLGALLTDNRIDFDGLALAATAEILAIGLGSIAATVGITSTHLKAKAALLMLIAAVFNYLTATADTPTLIIAYRGLTGLAEGGLVAFAVELIARSRRAGRFGGYFVMMQTVAQAALAAGLAFLVIPFNGSKGGFESLAIVQLVSILVVFWLPTEYGALPKPDTEEATGLFRLPPLVALGSVLTFAMFLGAIWAFLEPLAATVGIDAQSAGLMVSLALGAQVTGAVIATFAEARLPHRATLAVVGVVGAVIAVSMASGPDATVFWVLTMITGLTFLFVLPFQIRMTIEADETRRAALLVPAMQLCGAAFGPALASIFIVGDNVVPVAWFACGAALTSAALTILFANMRRRVASI